MYVSVRSDLQMSTSKTLKHFRCVTVNDRIEREVVGYEEKYRGRELPGFINYKTFEVMIKEQIKQLEEPAVKKLKDISGENSMTECMIDLSSIMFFVNIQVFS